MGWFPYLIFSVFASFGLAVALVKKGDEWPVRRYRIWLERHILPSLHRKLPAMLSCVVCTSFWTTLVTDTVICVFTGFRYWAWPLSGFVTLGLTWLVMDLSNTLFKLSKRGNKNEV
jgi:hypothetical protein